MGGLGRDAAVRDGRSGAAAQQPATPVQDNELIETWNERVAAGAGPGAMAGGVDAVEIYDPATRRRSTGAPLPAPRGGITGAVHAGGMLVFGGEGERGHVLGLTPTTYAYDPRGDRWDAPARPSDRGARAEGSAVIGGRIFLPGGAITLGGNTGTNAMQMYS